VGGGGERDREGLQAFIRQHLLSISATCDPEKILVSIQCRKNKVEKGMELLHALINQPRFCASSLQAAKAQIHARNTHLESVLQHRTAMAALHLLASHPSAAFLDESKADLATLELPHVRQLMRLLLTHSQLEILIVGPVEPEQVKASALRYLASIRPLQHIPYWGEEEACLAGGLHAPREVGSGGGGVVGGAEGGGAEGSLSGSLSREGVVLKRMLSFRYSLGQERRATTICLAGDTIDAHVVLLAACVNRWGYTEEETQQRNRFHSTPEWQLALPGKAANGALYVSRCMALAMLAAETRLQVALEGHGVQMVKLRWFPFDVIAGGIMSCEIVPHVDKLEEAVAASQHVLQLVWE
jgi:hypothetical protein